MNTPAHVYVFEGPNQIQMTAVVDQYGQQVPELQGRWADVERKVFEAMDEDTVLHGVDRRAWMLRMISGRTS